MKNTVLSIALALTGSLAQAGSLYLVEPMKCIGTKVGGGNVHPSFAQVAMTLTSFRSMRRDGSLANSLQVSNVYFNPAEKVVFGQPGQEEWFLSPLKLTDSEVSHLSLGSPNESLRLHIVSRGSEYLGRRTDKLEGTWGRPGSVAGDYSYSLKCQAIVVAKASKILDYTNR